MSQSEDYSDRYDYKESPYLSMLGTTLEEWREGHVRIGLALQPFHLNRFGVIHGGVIAALLDHAGGLPGLYCTVPGNRRYAMTLSLTSNFVGQSRTGKVVAIGELVKAGSRVFFTRSEVQTDTGLVLASGTGVYRYRSGSESPEGVPARKAE